MTEDRRFGIDQWCELTLQERRELLAAELLDRLGAIPGVEGVTIEIGPEGREYDMTALVQTDVGRLRTPIWSHARATIFCDGSVHAANRAQLSPSGAIDEAADRLSRRMAVPYSLESRGLTVTLSPEPGVERTWTAEHSLFRKRTAVVREDRVDRAGDLDVRDLLAHFYSGPSLRLVSDSGEAFLLPEASEAEGPLVTLCHGCGGWSDGAHTSCPSCLSASVETVIAARPPRR